MNGDIVKADDTGITAQVGDKTETIAWKDLADRSVGMLLNRCLDRENGDDWVAAGLLSIALGEPARAEGYFRQAEKLGAKTAPYLAPLAEAAFTRVEALLDVGGASLPRDNERGPETARLQAEQFSQAAAALADLQKKYGDTPWFAAHRQQVDAARTRAEGGIANAAAEKLYAQAAKLFEKKDLWSLKPVIEKLKADFPKATLIADAARKPTVAEMAEAVAKLGRFMTVSQSGRADHRTIQEAISTAPPGSLIEIQDSAVYRERLTIASGKQPFALRGKKGAWPIIIADFQSTRKDGTVEVAAPDVSIERILMVFNGSGSSREASDFWSCLCVRKGGFLRMRRTFMYCGSAIWPAALKISSGGRVEMQDCVLLGYTAQEGRLVAKTVLWLLQGKSGSSLRGGGSSDLSLCTMVGGIRLEREPAAILNSILPEVVATRPGTQLEHCVVHGKGFLEQARAGKGCFGGDPQFRDPANLDYRLKPTSPCKGKASDGGDIGCRYTPEMLEMLQKALELRKKGIIKF
jgi:hypothetical protein